MQCLPGVSQSQRVLVPDTSYRLGTAAAFCSLACGNVPKPPRQSLLCPHDKLPQGRLIWMLFFWPSSFFPGLEGYFFPLRTWHKGLVGETCVDSRVSLRMLQAQLFLKGLGWTSCHEPVAQRMCSLLTPAAQVCHGINKIPLTGKSPSSTAARAGLLCFQQLPCPKRFDFLNC